MTTEKHIYLIHNPYLGIIKVSENKAVIIWCIRLIFLGVIIYDFFKWIYEGINPFIPF